MTLVHFGTSVFGSLNSSMLSFVRSSFTQSTQLIDACPPSRSMVMSDFDSSGFGSFNTPPLLSLRDHDPLIRVLLDLMVQIHFGSSSFKSFTLLHTHSSRSSFTRRQGIYSTRPSGSNGPNSLRPFGVREFQTPTHSFLLDFFHPKNQIF
jgi:hypothetical protein